MGLPRTRVAAKKKRSTSKQKGGEFERHICKKLGLWVTNGEAQDVFWRSAMSGGRATVAIRPKGSGVNANPTQILRRQAGDISAVAPEGHSLTDRFFIECKFHKELELAHFFLTGKGRLAKFWHKARAEAAQYDRSPMLIAKQNLWPILMITLPGALPLCERAVAFGQDALVYHFDEVMKSRYESLWRSE